jgi:hypothetical protein
MKAIKEQFTPAIKADRMYDLRFSIANQIDGSFVV